MSLLLPSLVREAIAWVFESDIGLIVALRPAACVGTDVAAFFRSNGRVVKVGRADDCVVFLFRGSDWLASELLAREFRLSGGSRHPVNRVRWQ